MLNSPSESPLELRRKLVQAVILLSTVTAVATGGYMWLSPNPVRLIDALYMTVITLAGVGYGEIIPTAHSIPLRIFNIFIVLIGVMITVYAFSTVTAFLVGGEIRNIFRRRKMLKRIAQLDRHYIICGLGATGRHAAMEFHKTGTPFVVVEASEEAIKRFIESQGAAYDEMLYITGDATDEDVLTAAGVERAAGLISALSADKDNLVATVIVRQKNAEVRIVARCVDPKFADRLTRAGANAVVSPNQIGGLRMASEALRPHVVSFLDVMIKDQHSTERIEEIVIVRHSSWIGVTLGELRLKERFRILPLGVRFAREMEGKQYEVNPSDTHVIEAHEVVIVLGATTDVRTARHDSQHVRAAAAAAR